MRAKWNQNVISPYDNYKEYTKIVKKNFMLTKWLLSCFSCSKELGQWDLLTEFGKTKGHANPFLGKFDIN